jgi:hypothetical protein
MDQFKNKGGVLSGREERYDEFAGVPKNIGGGTAGGFGHIRDGGHHSDSEHHKHGDLDNTPSHGGSHVGTDGVIGSGGYAGQHDSTTGKKPSLMDKLNPKKDADGDGKAGFMK